MTAVIDIYTVLAQVPGVARQILEKLKKLNLDFFTYVTPRVPMGSLKKFQPIWFSRLASFS